MYRSQYITQVVPVTRDWWYWKRLKPEIWGRAAEGFGLRLSGLYGGALAWRIWEVYVHSWKKPLTLVRRESLRQTFWTLTWSNPWLFMCCQYFYWLLLFVGTVSCYQFSYILTVSAFLFFQIKKSILQFRFWLKTTTSARNTAFR